MEGDYDKNTVYEVFKELKTLRKEWQLIMIPARVRKPSDLAALHLPSNTHGA